MGNTIALCVGGNSARRAAHDASTERLLVKFRRDQEQTQHKIKLEEAHFQQLTTDAMRLKQESEKIANKADPQRRRLEQQAKEKLAHRKQRQEQLQRLQSSANEENKMILRLESLRDSAPQANLYKEAKRQIEGYERFMAVDDLAEIRDQVDEAWRNAENLRETPRTVDRDSVEIDNEFKSLNVDLPMSASLSDMLSLKTVGKSGQYDSNWDDDLELDLVKNEMPRRVLHA